MSEQATQVPSTITTPSNATYKHSDAVNPGSTPAEDHTASQCTPHDDENSDSDQDIDTTPCKPLGYQLIEDPVKADLRDKRDWHNLNYDRRMPLAHRSKMEGFEDPVSTLAAKLFDGSTGGRTQDELKEYQDHKDKLTRQWASEALGSMSVDEQKIFVKGIDWSDQVTEEEVKEAITAQIGALWGDGTQVPSMLLQKCVFESLLGTWETRLKDYVQSQASRAASNGLASAGATTM